MCIGILTFHDAINYGAVIQAWALQTTLQHMGHIVSIIDYRRGARPKLPWALGLLWRTIRYDFSLMRKEIPFWWFRMRHLNETRKGSSVTECLGGRVDAVVVGSDQVWNPIYLIDNNGSIDRNYFLGNVPDGCRRIAYAASMGEAKFGAYTNEVKEMLRRFTGISVRERFAQSVLYGMGLTKIDVVPDPTLLLLRRDYDTIANRNGAGGSRRRIFTYALGEIKKCMRELIVELELDSESVGRVVVLRDYCIEKHSRIHRVYPSPSQWLSEIRLADLIITDSFHCMIMAIIHHKPFRMIYKTLEPMTNDRMKTTLDILGIIDTEHPNWESVDFRLEEYRDVGLQYLRRMLA